MSSYVDKEWFYYLRGREILLYKLQGGISTGRISQSGVFQSYDKELVYPDEDIADGLRIEYTRVSEPFVAEALETTTAYASGTNISFALSGARITTQTSNFWDTISGFEVGDKIRIRGSASNDADYTIDSFSGSSNVNMIVSGSTLTDETAGERISITQIPKEDSSPSATSHINLNKMLNLAVIDYCKAMLAERNGEIDKKEYFMKEFYSKLGDNESNKRNISVAFPAGPFAVK
tara:strand:- start:1244 stop:1945 length:702 start_codon:yes stop_codon:yes gene_type:complete